MDVPMAGETAFVRTADSPRVEDSSGVCEEVFDSLALLPLMVVLTSVYCLAEEDVTAKGCCVGFAVVKLAIKFAVGDWATTV